MKFLTGFELLSSKDVHDFFPGKLVVIRCLTKEEVGSNQNVI